MLLPTRNKQYPVVTFDSLADIKAKLLENMRMHVSSTSKAVCLHQRKPENNPLYRFIQRKKIVWILPNRKEPAWVQAEYWREWDGMLQISVIEVTTSLGAEVAEELSKILTLGITPY